MRPHRDHLKRLWMLPFLILLFSVLLVAREATSGTWYVVVKPLANMYREPDVNSDVVSQAIYASNVTLLQTKRHWAWIRTPDEYKGWTQRANLRSSFRCFGGRGKIPLKIDRLELPFHDDARL